MLITFKTDAYESIMYFGTVAQRLLTMMGQSGSVPGALLAHDVPEALAKLTRALQRQQPKMGHVVDDDGESDVSLAHRALPLIALLEAAVKKHCDVLWG